MAPAEQTEPRAKRARFAEEEQEPNLFAEEDDRQGLRIALEAAEGIFHFADCCLMQHGNGFAISSCMRSACSYQEYIPLKKRRQMEEQELSKRPGMVSTV